MNKKILSAFLSLIFIFTIISPSAAAATETPTTRQINGMNIASSVTDEQIANLPHAVIDRLQNTDSTLVSVSTECFSLDQNTGIATHAVMPTYDFRITVTASELSKGAKLIDGLKETDDAFEFVAVGRWYANPLFEFTDCIGITWSDEFTLYKDDGYTYSYEDGHKRYSTMKLNDVSPEQGFAYDADLQLFDRQDEIVIIGRVYKPNSSGSANVCASYGHVTIRPSSIDVSFSSGKELGMSVGLAAVLEKASPDYDYFNY